MVKLDQRKDPRLIPLGSLLRASGLDELPQLINVLRGEMSLVGPRPCIPYECEAYEAWHRQRFNALPGLTGLWQVSGKNRTTFDQMVRLDIEYSERQSLWLDVKIIAMTLPAVWRQFCDLQAPRQSEALPQVSNTLETFSA
jgi:lipopolysaccharide/colanic/teichoic acid biosynthesis glycosyltransferase